MNEYEAKIASIVAEKSVDFFDQVLETARLMGYEVIKSVVLRDIPTNSNVAVDPMAIMKLVLEKMEASQLKKAMTKEGANYVKLSEFVEVKSDKPC
jgi:hypothetical protein